MGGFINKSKKRVPGAKIKCHSCMQELDEINFSFSTSGYYSYCYECARKKSKKARERDKLNILLGIEKKVNDTDPYELRNTLEFVKKCIRPGYKITVKGEVQNVTYVNQSFVKVANSAGKEESFIWVDILPFIIKDLKEQNMKGG